MDRLLAGFMRQLVKKLRRSVTEMGKHADSGTYDGALSDGIVEAWASTGDEILRNGWIIWLRSLQSVSGQMDICLHRERNFSIGSKIKNRHGFPGIRCINSCRDW